MLTIRLATEADFRAFYDCDPPTDNCVVMCGDRDGKIVGMAGVYYDPNGVALGFLDIGRRLGQVVPGVAVAQVAREADCLDHARDIGCRLVHRSVPL